MIEINKPPSMKYWLATDNDTVLHIGKTGTNQVTTTGLVVLQQSSNELGLIGLLNSHVSKLPVLPSEGLVDEDRHFQFQGRPILVKKEHERGTGNDPDPDNDVDDFFLQVLP